MPIQCFHVVGRVPSPGAWWNDVSLSAVRAGIPLLLSIFRFMGRAQGDSPGQSESASAALGESPLYHQPCKGGTNRLRLRIVSMAESSTHSDSHEMHLPAPRLLCGDPLAWQRGPHHTVRVTPYACLAQQERIRKFQQRAAHPFSSRDQLHH